jgi:peroxiredoxin
MSKRKARKKSPPVVPMFVMGAVFIIGAALIIALSANSDKAQQNTSYLIPPASVNRAAPDLTLTDLEGKTVSLSDYKGQVVLVNNWATWCPPCLAEIPELQAYYDVHADEGFVLIGIEAGEPVSEVAAFVQSHGLTYPIWPDPNTRAVNAFQNGSLPSSYVIDRDGIIIYAWSGQINQPTLDKYVTPLLVP